MKKLVVCLGIVIALVAFEKASHADFVITRSNNSGANIGGPTVIQRFIDFSVADFPSNVNPSLVKIKDIEVAVSFTKLGATPNSQPFFNEVSVVFGKSEGPTVNLINSGNAAGSGSFAAGALGASFDGVVTFNMSAADVVNVNTNLIQSGTFKPIAGQDLGVFAGQGVPGRYTLFIGDNGGSPALVFRNYSVTITAVPEPTSLAFLGLLAPAGAFVRRRRRVS